MSNVTYFVGLDYHQHSVQVCVMNSDGHIIRNISRRNDWREVAEVVPKDGRVFAAIEACNGAASFAEELIARAGWSSIWLTRGMWLASNKVRTKVTGLTPSCWQTWNASAICPRSGWLRKRLGNSGDWFGSGSNWSISVATSSSGFVRSCEISEPKVLRV